MDLLVGYLVVSAICFFIMVFITRAIFMIPTIVDNLKQQTEYLRDIAVTQRVILKNLEETKKNSPETATN